MADMEHAMAITEKLYACRRAARTLLGTKFDARMREFGHAIREVAAKRNTTELKAAIALGQAAQDDGNDFLFLEVMAAYVELAEPSTREAAHA
ncbi:MAG: hypothetical protein HOQ02_04635 [Lysobacter sp.]|nr:hypothetical protein [Lysobacter sp.]